MRGLFADRQSHEISMWTKYRKPWKKPQSTLKHWNYLSFALFYAHGDEPCRTCRGTPGLIQASKHGMPASEHDVRIMSEKHILLIRHIALYRSLVSVPNIWVSCSTHIAWGAKLGGNSRMEGITKPNAHGTHATISSRAPGPEILSMAEPEEKSTEVCLFFIKLVCRTMSVSTQESVLTDS